MTQGDPLPPTIFNVVVDAVVRHWLTGVIAGAEDQGECGKEGGHQAALFYADDAMVASSGPLWLQGAFNNLVGLFDRVGLRTNIGRHLAWSVAPDRRRGIYWRRRMGGGSRGKAPHTGSA